MFILSEEVFLRGSLEWFLKSAALFSNEKADLDLIWQVSPNNEAYVIDFREPVSNVSNIGSLFSRRDISGTLKAYESSTSSTTYYYNHNTSFPEVHNAYNSPEWKAELPFQKGSSLSEEVLEEVKKREKEYLANKDDNIIEILPTVVNTSQDSEQSKPSNDEKEKQIFVKPKSMKKFRTLLEKLLNTTLIISDIEMIKLQVVDLIKEAFGKGVATVQMQKSQLAQILQYIFIYRTSSLKVAKNLLKLCASSSVTLTEEDILKLVGFTSMQDFEERYTKENISKNKGS